MIGEVRFTRAPADRAGCAELRAHAKPRTQAVELSFAADVLVAVEIAEEANMG